MARIFLYALVPYMLTCLTFGTDLFCVYLLSAFIFAVQCFIRRKRVFIGIFVVGFSFFASVACGNAHCLHKKSVYPFIDKNVTLTCVIKETPQKDSEYVRFTAEMLSVEHARESHNLNGMVAVRVDGCEKKLSYGDKISFKTKLNLPDTSHNTGGFNYEKYLRSQGISVDCYTSGFSIVNYGSHKNTLLLKIFRLRSVLLEKCDEYFDSRTSSFIKALLLGYKFDMPDDMNIFVTKSGISHIVSVSGLHLSILMLIAGLFLNRLKFRGSVFVIPALNIICALFITALTGFSPSVKRAALMIIVVNGLAIAYRESDSIHSLSFALLVLLFENPCALHDVRLSLSVTAVLGIVLCSNKISSFLRRFIKPRLLRETVATSISAQIIALPIAVYYFNTVSLVSVLTNTIVLPIIPYLMGAGVLFLAVPLKPIADFIAGGIWLAVQAILIVAKFFSSIPNSSLTMSFAYFSYSVILVSLAIILIRHTVTCKSTFKNIILTAISVLLIFITFFPPSRSTFEITVVNTGQSDCTLLKFPSGKTMLVSEAFGDDKTQPPSYDTSSFLIKNGITHIDYAVIPCLNNKTGDCILELAQSVSIGSIISSPIGAKKSVLFEKIAKLAKEKEIPVYLMKKGDNFAIDSHSRITVYSPNTKYTYNNDEGSLVFKAESLGHSVLFTGNIGFYAKSILAEEKADINSEIIKVPNHGVFTGSEKEFLNSVSPKKAFVCVEKDNFDNLPDRKTINLYSKNNIQLYRTDLDKTIKFVFQNRKE